MSSDQPTGSQPPKPVAEPTPQAPAEPAVYDVAPLEPPPPTSLPKGRIVERASKVGDAGLLDDFEEDADFSTDPEVERATGTGPKVDPTPVDAAAAGPTFIAPGGPAALKAIAIATGVLTISAVIAAALTAPSRGRLAFPDAFLTLYLTLLHTATGVAAVLFGAAVRGERAGDVVLATARMGFAVATFQLIFHLNIPVTGRTDEVLLAILAYVGILLVHFRFDRERLVLVAGVHAAQWLAIYLATVLWGWAQAPVK
ncbi:MAG: hypothetical protein RL689_1165 [Planctomycetota bacterium]|jgi:hypothetical protein